MPVEDKFGQKVDDPADPRRCQAVCSTGQCPYLAIESVKYCARHGGYRGIRQKDQEAAKMYNLMLWKHRLEALQESPQAKTLGAEIAILRMTLEATVEKCKTQEDLFMMSSTIGDLAIKIEKVLKSAHSLDQDSGNLMDKSKAIAFAGTVVEIINRVISARIIDTNLRESIVDEISENILTSLQNKTTEQNDG